MTAHRIALLGLGMAVAPHARAAEDLAREGRIEVAGAWSRSEARRQAFAEKFGLPVTGDLDRLVEDRSIDAVILVTPPNAREELVARLAAAGKHILMEKPVERTTAAATRIVERCEQSGTVLGIVFQHRFREGSARLRALIDGGELGRLAAVQLTVPWWRPQGYYDEPGRGTLARDGGGVLISQAIHSLDLMLSLTGPVTEVAAIAGTTPLHRMETEDFVGAGLRFANGALGGLIATTAAAPGGPERLVLSGERLTATLEAGTLTLQHQDGRSERFGETVGSGGGGADPMAFPYDWHKALLTDFLDALDAERPPRISGREALRVHHLIDALLISSREGTRASVASAG